MNVSIIIVNYNTFDLLQQCIRSIYEKTSTISFEIIVVDNASTEKRCDEVRINFPEVKLIESVDNLGFGKANNLGFTKAKGDFILLLNPDTILKNNAIKILFDFLCSHKEYAIVGGELFTDNGQKTHSYGLFFPSILGDLDILWGRLLYKCREKRLKSNVIKKGFSKVAYITGADMMIRRTDIEKWGLFDSDFFMYYEETELTYRYTKKNRFSAFYPKAEIVHLEGKSFSFKEMRERRYFEGRKTYYNKTHSVCYKNIADVIFLFIAYIAIVKNRIRRCDGKSLEWQKRLAIFKEINGLS